jgi:amino acid adenylation domain-containing protein
MLELIEKLNKEGIKLRLSGDDLKVSFSGEQLNPELLEELKSNKQELVAYLQKYTNTSTYKNIPKVPEQELYKVSSAQRRLLILSKFEGGSEAYNLPYRTNFSGDYNIEFLRKSIDALIERHEILRTIFVEDEGEMYQKVLSSEELNFKMNVLDYRNLEDKEERFNKFYEEDSYAPFDLYKGPLIRATIAQFEDDQFIFYFNMHHVISDGWSFKILNRDLFAFYEAFRDRHATTLPELKIQYKDYSEWKLQAIPDFGQDSGKKYWMESLSGELPVLSFPSEKTRPKVKTNNGEIIEGYIAADTSKALHAYCRDHGGSFFMGLLSVWNILCHRYTGQDDFITGTVVAGREHPDLENQIGFYVNTLALRNSVKSGESFDEVFARIKETTLSAFANQMYAFDELVNDLNLPRSTNRSAVFDVMISLLNTMENKEEVTLTELAEREILNHGKGIAMFDINITFKEFGKYVHFSVNFNSDVYDSSFVIQLMKHYRILMDQVLKSPSSSVNEINILQSGELKQLDIFNATETTFDTDQSIVERFQNHSKNTPNAIAVEFKSKIISYEHFDQLTSQIANALEDQGVQPGDTVGIQLERSEWLVAAIWGILKVRAMYVPIDPLFPQDYIDYIKSDSGCTLVIDLDWIQMFEGKSEKYSGINERKGYLLEDSAYVIYTSGTTGQPKGVINLHSGLLNRLLWMQQDIAVTEDMVFIQKTPFTFDVSVWELILPLISGAKLLVAEPEMHKNPKYLLDTIQNKKISVIHFVPSMLEVFCETMKANESIDLKHIICSGEALTQTVVKLAREKFPNAQLHNYYGPTEAAIDVTAINLTSEGCNGNSISIGRPKPNTKIYIVNEAGTLQPLNIWGELLIGGVQVAQGYLNKPQLTEEKFIKNPFGNDRLYKTGDIARWLPNGTLEFLGRNDDQVKIRGHRIELGIVKEAVRLLDGVETAFVLALNSQNEEKQLVVYYTTREELNTSDLRRGLKKQLPEYMIPSYFIHIEEIPFTTNGKLDIKSLPAPGGEVKTGVYYEEARNEMETQLVEIWKEILNQDKIGIHDDFFVLGGHSIKAIKMIYEIQRKLNVKLELTEVFVEPTIAQLAVHIENHIWQRESINEEDVSDRIVI